MYRNTCIGWYNELRGMRIMEGTCIISQSFISTFSSLKQSFSLCKCSVLSGLCGDAHFSCMRHQVGFSIASGGSIFKMAYSQDWWIATHSNWEVIQGFGLRTISCPHRLLHGTDFTFQHMGLKSECSQWGTITRQSGWLLSKSLHAINAGEGVEKREPSYTVGGNAN